MPYKKGGGGHLQFYDESDGEYDEESKRRANEDDKRALGIYYFFRVPADYLIFHWPVQGVHDRQYCILFAKYARGEISKIEMDIRKCAYLLSFRQANDKSKFAKGLGYSIGDCEQLKKDIIENTDIRTIRFSRYEASTFMCIAKTILKSKIVTTVWAIDKDFTIRFITLIPGGGKRWK